MAGELATNTSTATSAANTANAASTAATAATAAVATLTEQVEALDPVKSNQYGINPLYPPAPMVAAVGDGIADDTAALQAILNTYGWLDIPRGKYFKITSKLSIVDKRITGPGCLSGGIIQYTDAESVIGIGGKCYIADCYIGHASLPSSPYAYGLETVAAVEDVSFIGRLLLENNSDGIYNEDFNIFSATIQDIRSTRFTHSGFWFGGNGNTGCSIDNLYCVNWDDYGSGTKLSAYCGIYFAGYTDGVVGQINIEHGNYEQGLVMPDCENFVIKSLHLEGYVADSDYDSMIYVGSGNVQINSATAIFDTFDAANITDYSFIKLGYDAKIRIGSVKHRDNTKTGSPTLHRFYGDGTQEAGASVYVDNYSSDVFTGGDYFPVNTQANPVLKKLNDFVYFSQYKGNTAVALATSGTIAVTMTDSEVFTITPAGACTFNASGGYAGKRCNFIVTTSGTTSYTLTWGTNFKTTGTLATGTTTAKVFVVNFVCKDGTTWVETGRTAAM